MEATPQQLKVLPPPLLAWYDENRRVLPWREQVSPYRTWVSEIMLQQTRVTAVLPYFEPGALPERTRKKAIRKALESYRISPERKAYLRGIG